MTPLGKKLIDKLLNGPTAHIWNQAVSNEMGRLTKGNDAGVSWTDSMEFITKCDVPQNKKGYLFQFCLCSLYHSIRSHLYDPIF